MHGAHIFGIDDKDAEEVASLLCLSTKYDFPSLKKAAVAYLEQMFPSTLSDWDDALELDLGYGKVRISTLLIIANAAHETSSTHLLPIILLYCAGLEMSIIARGIDYGGHHFELDSEMKTAVFMGVPVLYDICRQKGFRIFQEHLRPGSSPACQRGCALIRVGGAKKMERYLKLDTFSPWSILKGVPQQNILTNLMEQGYCKSCQFDDLETIQVEREKIWDGLPAVFGLPSWDDLRPDDDD